MEIKNIMFMANGNTAAFDHDGQQVPQLQESWLRLYVRFLEQQGVDPTGIVLKTPLGNARWLPEHDNWEFI